MGFIEDKTDLFSQIAVVNAIKENFPELNDTINSFNSVKSADGNIIKVLLDLLRTLVDSGAIKEQFNVILQKTGTFEEKIKTKIADTVIGTYTRNFDFELPTGTILKTSLKNIDLKDTLKIDPNSEMGKFSYGKDSSVDFTRFLFDTIQSIDTTTPNSTATGTWNNILDFSIDTSDSVEVSFNSNFVNKGFEDFVYDFINSIRILDLSQLLSTILDTLFGAISSLSDVGEQWILDQLKVTEKVNQIISAEALNDTVIYDNSFFEFSPEQMANIKKKADGLTNGSHLSDLGCGFSESFIDLDAFSKSFDDINDIRPSLVKEATTNFTNTLLNQSTVGVNNEDRANVELNLFSELFENLPSMLFGMAIKPETLTIFQLAESIINGAGSTSGSIPSGLDLGVESLVESSMDRFMSQMKGIAVCLVKEVQSLIVEFLYDLVKAEIIKLAAVQVAKISQDQVESYQEILATVRDILKKVNNISSLIGGS